MKTLMTVVAGFTLVSVGLVTAQDEAAEKKEMALIKGLYKFESVEHEQGKKEDFGEATIRFSADGKAEFSKGGDTKKATYKVNPAGKPKELDLKPEDKDQTMLGIYKLEKDTLVLCITEGQNAARPTEFAAKDKCVLVTLKRVKE